MHRRTFLRKTTVLTAGIAGLAGCGSPDAPADGAENGTGPEDEPGAETGPGGAADVEGMVGETPDGVQVSNTQLQLSGGEAVVTGTVENTGDQAIEEVEVQVTLLDDNDEPIGQFFHDTDQAEVESIEPGATWDFSVSFPEEDLEDAASYRIDADTSIDQNVDFDVGA